ncbi:MAG: T9SS type A sorting domain-containing protein [Bacteroidia bacterium]|nr:T9SS type A sorting domain-containing protein [Bacteroidia bacterium]MCZ2277379.1 T9SS type A sorting domain-containing protein [Bacteroidia bacterium]
MRPFQTPSLLLLTLLFSVSLTVQSFSQCLVSITDFNPSTCANTTIELLAYPDDFSQNYSYSWTGPNGFTCTDPYIHIPNSQPANSGTYQVTMTSSGGCVSQAEFLVIKNPVPVVCTGGQQGGCPGELTEVYAVDLSGSFGPYSYLWDSGDTSESILVGHNGFYPAPGCIMTNQFGCSASNNSTFMIGSYPLPSKPKVEASGPVEFCKGEHVQLSVKNPDSFQSYSWRKYQNLIPGSDSSAIIVNQPGRYWAVTSNSYGCVSTSAPVNVTVNPKPVAILTLNGNPQLCSGDSVELVANGGSNLSYQWKRFNKDLNGKTNQNFYARLRGNYKVTVTNEFGCSRASNLVSLEVNACRFTHPADDESVFAVYPNPSRTDFRLNFENQNVSAFIRILDMTGRVIEQKQLSTNESFGTHYAAGAYLLIAEINGQTYQKPIIKTDF